MQFDTDAPAAELPSKPYRQPAPPAPEFPGCRPIPLKREALADHDGRFEYWDGDTETAWVVREPTSATHEQPSQRLAGLGQIIAGVRGSPIECYGTMDLLLRNAQGEKWRIMQADQSVYLHPWRTRLPVDAMEIGRHDYPDVVLEVDHTTDVRRGKLWLYEAWGFPEIWVDVPESGYAVRRPAGLSPGLTIHLLEDDDYVTATHSRAFPGWSAVEIHTALNEEALSVETSRVLRRVGRTLGARTGTGPDDTPWLRMERQESRGEGRVQRAGLKGVRRGVRKAGPKGVRRACRRPSGRRAGTPGSPRGTALRRRNGAAALRAALPHRRPGPPRRGGRPDRRLRYRGRPDHPCGGARLRHSSIRHLSTLRISCTDRSGPVLFDGGDTDRPLTPFTTVPRGGCPVFLDDGDADRQAARVTLGRGHAADRVSVSRL